MKILSLLFIFFFVASTNASNTCSKLFQNKITDQKLISYFTPEKAVLLERELDQSQTTKQLKNLVEEFVNTDAFKRYPDLTMKALLWSLQNKTSPTEDVKAPSPAFPIYAGDPIFPSIPANPFPNIPQFPGQNPAIPLGQFPDPFSSEPAIFTPEYVIFEKLISRPGLLQVAAHSDLKKLAQHPTLGVLLNDHAKLFQKAVTEAYLAENISRLKNFEEFVSILSLAKIFSESVDDFVDETANLIVSLFNGNYNSFHSPTLRVTPMALSIPPYNIFKMIKENIRRLLQQPHKNFQDIILARDTSPFRLDDQWHVLVFSNSPIDSEPLNKYGFSVKELKTFDQRVPGIKEQFSWNNNGKSVSADLHYFPLDIKLGSFIGEKSPRYQDFLSDKSLTGLIMISKDLTGFSPFEEQDPNKVPFSTTLSQNYQDYLSSQGFKIQKLGTKSKSEAYRFITEKTQQNEIDYAIREGHTEFSPESLITLTEQVIIYKATKSSLSTKFKNAYPYNETVYVLESLFDPNTTPLSQSHDALTSMDFGNALKERANPNAQFLFFDSACHAHCNVGSRLEFVAAPAFVLVGSNELVDTFTETPGSSVYEFLSGLRQLRSYREINKRITSDEKIVFPDQKDDYLTLAAVKNLRPMQLQIRRHW